MRGKRGHNLAEENPRAWRDHFTKNCCSRSGFRGLRYKGVTVFFNGFLKKKHRPSLILSSDTFHTPAVAIRSRCLRFIAQDCSFWFTTRCHMACSHLYAYVYICRWAMRKPAGEADSNRRSETATLGSASYKQTPRGRTQLHMLESITYVKNVEKTLSVFLIWVPLEVQGCNTATHQWL